MTDPEVQALAELLHGRRDPEDTYDDPEARRHGIEDCDNAQDWLDEAARLHARGVRVAPSPTEAIERLARLLVDESAYGNLEAAKAAIARAGVAPSPDAPASDGLPVNHPDRGWINGAPVSPEHPCPTCGCVGSATGRQP